MWKRISLKGIILGSIADVGGTNLWGIALYLYLISTHQIQITPSSSQLAEQLQNILSHNVLVMGLNLMVGGEFSVLGGYLAARIAKHDELLNGALSSFLCVLSSILAVGSASFLKVLISIVISPILGFLGGYLRLRQVKNVNTADLVLDFKKLFKL